MCRVIRGILSIALITAPVMGMTGNTEMMNRMARELTETNEMAFDALVKNPSDGRYRLKAAIIMGKVVDQGTIKLSDLSAHRERLSQEGTSSDSAVSIRSIDLPVIGIGEANAPRAESSSSSPAFFTLEALQLDRQPETDSAPTGGGMRIFHW